MYYFATVIFIMLSANGTFLPFFNIDWFLVEFIFIWIGIEHNRFNKRDIRIFLNFSAIYIGYCTFRSIFLNSLPSSYYISDIIYLFKYILPSFLYCALLKEKAIYYLSKVIIHGAMISIPFYFIQVVAGDMLFSIGQSLSIPPLVGIDYVTNFLVFTFVKPHPFQNSGFSWEPGAYGFFLNVGLILHFLNNGFKIDKNAKWLILAIITTVSTTSIIALILVFLLLLRAKGLKIGTLLVVAVPVFCVAIFQLPFLADKIVGTYVHDMKDMKNIQFLSAYYIKMGEPFALNRFGSLLFIYQLFGAKLIFGISNVYTETESILKNVNISNGIFEFFAKFGVIGMIFLLYRGYLFFRTYTANFEQAFYCILLILIFGFAESIFVLPIVTTLFFLYKYAQPVEQEKEFQESELELQNA